MSINHVSNSLMEVHRALQSLKTCNSLQKLVHEFIILKSGLDKLSRNVDKITRSSGIVNQQQQQFINQKIIAIKNQSAELCKKLQECVQHPHNDSIATDKNRLFVSIETDLVYVDNYIIQPVEPQAVSKQRRIGQFVENIDESLELLSVTKLDYQRLMLLADATIRHAEAIIGIIGCTDKEHPLRDVINEIRSGLLNADIQHRLSINGDLALCFRTLETLANEAVVDLFCVTFNDPLLPYNNMLSLVTSLQDSGDSTQLNEAIQLIGLHGRAALDVANLVTCSCENEERYGTICEKIRQFEALHKRVEDLLVDDKQSMAVSHSLSPWLRTYLDCRNKSLHELTSTLQETLVPVVQVEFLKYRLHCRLERAGDVNVVDNLEFLSNCLDFYEKQWQLCEKVHSPVLWMQKFKHELDFSEADINADHKVRCLIEEFIDELDRFLASADQRIEHSDLSQSVAFEECVEEDAISQAVSRDQVTASYAANRYLSKPSTAAVSPQPTAPRRLQRQPAPSGQPSTTATTNLRYPGNAAATEYSIGTEESPAISTADSTYLPASVSGAAAIKTDDSSPLGGSLAAVVAAGDGDDVAAVRAMLAAAAAGSQREVETARATIRRRVARFARLARLCGPHLEDRDSVVQMDQQINDLSMLETNIGELCVRLAHGYQIDNHALKEHCENWNEVLRSLRALLLRLCDDCSEIVTRAVADARSGAAPRKEGKTPAPLEAHHHTAMEAVRSFVDLCQLLQTDDATNEEEEPKDGKETTSANSTTRTVQALADAMETSFDRLRAYICNADNNDIDDHNRDHLRRKHADYDREDSEAEDAREDGSVWLVYTLAARALIGRALARFHHDGDQSATASSELMTSSHVLPIERCEERTRALRNSVSLIAQSPAAVSSAQPAETAADDSSVVSAVGRIHTEVAALDGLVGRMRRLSEERGETVLASLERQVAYCTWINKFHTVDGLLDEAIAHVIGPLNNIIEVAIASKAQPSLPEVHRHQRDSLTGSITNIGIVLKRHSVVYADQHDAATHVPSRRPITEQESVGWAATLTDLCKAFLRSVDHLVTHDDDHRQPVVATPVIDIAMENKRALACMLHYVAGRLRDAVGMDSLMSPPLRITEEGQEESPEQEDILALPVESTEVTTLPAERRRSYARLLRPTMQLSPPANDDELEDKAITEENSTTAEKGTATADKCKEVLPRIVFPHQGKASRFIELAERLEKRISSHEDVETDDLMYLIRQMCIPLSEMLRHARESEKALACVKDVVESSAKLRHFALTVCKYSKDRECRTRLLEKANQIDTAAQGIKILSRVKQRQGSSMGLALVQEDQFITAGFGMLRTVEETLLCVESCFMSGVTAEAVSGPTEHAERDGKEGPDKSDSVEEGARIVRLARDWCRRVAAHRHRRVLAASSPGVGEVGRSQSSAAAGAAAVSTASGVARDSLRSVRGMEATEPRLSFAMK